MQESAILSVLTKPSPLKVCTHSLPVLSRAHNRDFHLWKEANDVYLTHPGSVSRSLWASMSIIYDVGGSVHLINGLELNHLMTSTSVSPLHKSSQNYRCIWKTPENCAHISALHNDPDSRIVRDLVTNVLIRICNALLAKLHKKPRKLVKSIPSNMWTLQWNTTN